MKILLVAPEICSPWTEGRKRFVRDLCTSLARQDDVSIITTLPPGHVTDFPVPHRQATCRTKPGHLLSLHRLLHEELTSFRPDLVCHFPYGTFRHVYRLANLWSMGHVDRSCRKHRTTCFTIMYSISNETSLNTLQASVTHLVPIRLPPAKTDNAIRLGIDFGDWRTLAATDRRVTHGKLLFMAGMWQQTRARAEHVLNVRGLRLLLQAGKRLSSRGLSLTVAVPLLADKSLRDYLRQHHDNTWPDGTLHFESETKVPDIFTSHDLFVFPYMREETQFIPTSVIEAMAAGIPVVLPQLSFLGDLAGNGEQAFTYPAADAMALADVVIAAVSDISQMNQVRTNALRYVREQMDIEHSCHDLRQRYQMAHT
jgi:glycosyltransferase involved in cell wall biosynthesis